MASKYRTRYLPTLRRQAVRTIPMATYRVYGTSKASPAESDWKLLAETSDPVAATQAAHESEGTFWRRLTEDDQIVLDRV